MPHSSDDAEDMSPEALEKRFRRTIAIYATRVRIEWGLPVSTEPELRAYGQVGLYEARTRFDRSRGAAFATYAEYRIHGATRNGARAMYHTRSIAHTLKNQASDETGWDRVATLYEELAVAGAMAAAPDASGRIEGPTSEDTPEVQLQRREEQQLMQRAFALLSPRRQEVLRLVLEELGTDEIAKRMGVHKSRVSNLKREATAILTDNVKRLSRKPDGT